MKGPAMPGFSVWVVEMPVSDLIKEFETLTSLPVDVNHVVEFLKRNNVKDEINFIEADLDINILRGQLVEWEVPGIGYAEPTLVADIYYAENQGNDWKRFVCCKELLHLLDPYAVKVREKQDFLRLVEKIILPPELQSTEKIGAHATSDKLAIYQALAVMLPWEAREIFRHGVEEGQLAVTDIARIADIPLRFVNLAMSDMWTGVYKALREI